MHAGLSARVCENFSSVLSNIYVRACTHVSDCVCTGPGLVWKSHTHMYLLGASGASIGEAGTLFSNL